MLFCPSLPKLCYILYWCRLFMQTAARSSLYRAWSPWKQSCDRSPLLEHIPLSLSPEQAGQGWGRQLQPPPPPPATPAQPLPDLRLWACLPGWKAKQPWPVQIISLRAQVCVYFLIYLSWSSPCRELQRCKMCGVSVCMEGGAPERAGILPLSDLCIPHREGFFSFSFLLKHLGWGKSLHWLSKRNR